MGALHVPYELVVYILRIRSRLMRADRWRASFAAVSARLQFPRRVDKDRRGFRFNVWQRPRRPCHHWFFYESTDLNHHYYAVDPEQQQVIVRYYHTNALGTYVKRGDRWERVTPLYQRLGLGGDTRLLDGGLVFHEDHIPGMFLDDNVRVLMQPLPIPYALAEHARNLPNDARDYLAHYYRPRYNFPLTLS